MNLHGNLRGASQNDSDFEHRIRSISHLTNLFLSTISVILSDCGDESLFVAEPGLCRGPASQRILCRCRPSATSVNEQHMAAFDQLARLLVKHVYHKYSLAP
jgi:hypothetical protein